MLSFVRAVSALLPADRTDLYWAGRATLISRHDLISDYDEAFEAWFRDIGTPVLITMEPAAGPDNGELRPDAPDQDRDDLEVRVGTTSARWRPLGTDDESGDEEAAIGIVASDVAVVRQKSFDDLTEDEERTAQSLIRQLRLRAPERRSRRTRPSGKGSRFDLRQTLRRSLRTEGEPLRREWRSQKTRRRPIVLILDVSGSMAAYSRALLLFAHAAMASGARVEAFVFGTELSRVTPPF